MPFSEADQRTVLLHLEVIRSIIRGANPEATGDVVEVADGYVKRAEPDLDGGAARQAAETALRRQMNTAAWADIGSDEAEIRRLAAQLVGGKPQA